MKSIDSLHKKKIRMIYRILLYVFAFYTLYLYVAEILGEYKIGLSYFQFMEKIDGFLELFGGIFFGFLLTRTGIRFDKYFGITVIAINIILGWYLLSKAVE